MHRAIAYAVMTFQKFLNIICIIYYQGRPLYIFYREGKIINIFIFFLTVFK